MDYELAIVLARAMSDTSMIVVNSVRREFLASGAAWIDVADGRSLRRTMARKRTESIDPGPDTIAAIYDMLPKEGLLSVAGDRQRIASIGFLNFKEAFDAGSLRGAL